MVSISRLVDQPLEGWLGMKSMLPVSRDFDLLVAVELPKAFFLNLSNKVKATSSAIVQTTLSNSKIEMVGIVLHDCGSSYRYFHKELHRLWYLVLHTW